VLAVSSVVVADPIPNLDPKADFTGVISGEKMHANFANIEERLAASETARPGDPAVGASVAGWVGYATAPSDADAVIDALEVELETTGRAVEVRLAGAGSQPFIAGSVNAGNLEFTFRIERLTEGEDVDWVTVEEFYWRNFTGQGFTVLRVPPGSLRAADAPEAGTTTYRVIAWAEPSAGNPSVDLARVRLVAQELAVNAGE
jgi:hypothetical protein